MQTHSGQKLLNLPRRFIKSAVALCFNAPKYQVAKTTSSSSYNRPHKFLERLHRLIGTFPLYTRYLFEKVCSTKNLPLRRENAFVQLQYMKFPHVSNILSQRFVRHNCNFQYIFTNMRALIFFKGKKLT